MAGATSGRMLAALGRRNDFAVSGIGTRKALQPVAPTPFAAVTYAVDIAAVPQPSLALPRGYSGNNKIAGQVTLNSVGDQGIWIFLAPDNAPSLCLRSTITDKNGNYVFNNLAPGLYLVETWDPTGVYNSYVYNKVASVPM